MSHDALAAFLREHGIQHFSAREIAPQALPPERIWGFILPTLQVAERLRSRLGEGGNILVTSGYRDPAHNRRVGGALNSLHVKFNALDIIPRRGSHRVDLQEAADLLRRDPRAGEILSVGRYSTFIHIDTRALFWPDGHALGRPWINI